MRSRWSGERQFIEKLLFLPLAVITLGIAGLMIIEGWSFFDALYMTVITISTVGYHEVHPLSTHGRIFILFLILTGVGTFLYIISNTAEYVMAGYLRGAMGRRKMKKKIDTLRSHYIICGFGRVGHEVSAELDQEGSPFVVLDNNPDSIRHCLSHGYMYVEGDASTDDSLRESGIDRAAGLVAATDSDADNIYVILSAKSLNPSLFVVARANLDESVRKLRKAGADRVLSPYSIGGRRLASMLLRPAVIEFLDVVMSSGDTEILMREIDVTDRSSFTGSSIAEARIKCTTGANILAIKKKGEERIIVNPPTDTIITHGDKLIALGTKEQIKELKGMD